MGGENAKMQKRERDIKKNQERKVINHRKEEKKKEYVQISSTFRSLIILSLSAWSWPSCLAPGMLTPSALVIFCDAARIMDWGVYSWLWAWSSCEPRRPRSRSWTWRIGPNGSAVDLLSPEIRQDDESVCILPVFVRSLGAPCFSGCFVYSV